MENKLISMVEFVKQFNYVQEDFENAFITIRNYANFLSQPLSLWQFVPCDDEGNVLKEPAKDDYSFYTHKNVSVQEEWAEAKSKCLFEGFKVIGNDDDGVEIEMIDNDIWITIISTSININHYNGIEWEIKTVEEMFEFLKEYGLQASLSETALNQIY